MFCAYNVIVSIFVSFALCCAPSCACLYFRLIYYVCMRSSSLSGLSSPAFTCLSICLLCADAPPLSEELSGMFHMRKSCRAFHFVCFVDEVVLCLFCVVPDVLWSSFLLKCLAAGFRGFV
jgi:hypothetical protein